MLTRGNRGLIQDYIFACSLMSPHSEYLNIITAIHLEFRFLHYTFGFKVTPVISLHIAPLLLCLLGCGRRGETGEASRASSACSELLLVQDDVDDLTLVFLHVVQQVFFASRFETTDTAAEE